MSRPVLLSSERHSGMRVISGINIKRLEGQQVLPVVVHEISQAGSECPVVFIKNAETGQFQMVALLGLAQGENLMVQAGRWQGDYVPGILRSDPFRLMTTEADSDQMAIGIDDSSSLVNTQGTDGKGELLFNQDGQPSEYLQRRRDELIRYFEQGQVTRGFVAKLAELDLLKPQELAIDLDGEKSSIRGIYLVDEKKLRELEQAAFLDLRKRGFLPAIYAHMMSLNQVRRLGRLRVKQKPHVAGA